MVEIVKLIQIPIAWPMKYLNLEEITLVDARQASLLYNTSIEVITLADATMRDAMKFGIEQIRVADIRCSRGVSAIRTETLNVVDILCKQCSPYAFFESLLLSDVRMPMVVFNVSEALKILGTTIKAVSPLPLIDSIITVDGVNVKAKSYLLEVVNVIGTLGESVTVRMVTEVVRLVSQMNKIMPAQVLALETLVLTDTMTWFENIIHRLETKIRQFTDIKAEVKSTKETRIRKTVEETKRE
jgi:hypothetical protein